MLAAVVFGHRQFQPVIDLTIELAQVCAKEPWELQEADHTELKGAMKQELEADLRVAYGEPIKQLSVKITCFPRLAIVCFRERDARGRDIGRIETGLNFLKLKETFDQQSRTRE